MNEAEYRNRLNASASDLNGNDSASNPSQSKDSIVEVISDSNIEVIRQNETVDDEILKLEAL